MRITDRTIHAPFAEGWMQPRFHATDEFPAVYWKDTDRVAIVKGICDHGVTFGLMKDFHSDITEFESEVDRLLMWDVATSLDCSEHSGSIR